MSQLKYDVAEFLIHNRDDINFLFHYEDKIHQKAKEVFTTPMFEIYLDWYQEFKSLALKDYLVTETSLPVNFNNLDDFWDRDFIMLTLGKDFFKVEG